MHKRGHRHDERAHASTEQLRRDKGQVVHEERGPKSERSANAVCNGLQCVDEGDVLEEVQGQVDILSHEKRVARCPKDRPAGEKDWEAGVPRPSKREQAAGAARECCSQQHARYFETVRQAGHKDDADRSNVVNGIDQAELRVVQVSELRHDLQLQRVGKVIGELDANCEGEHQRQLRCSRRRAQLRRCDSRRILVPCLRLLLRSALTPLLPNFAEQQTNEHRGSDEDGIDEPRGRLVRGCSLCGKLLGEVGPIVLCVVAVAR
eukprot:scaffold88724_cov75-Phaeocystis_antarctica.AAC.4